LAGLFGLLLQFFIAEAFGRELNDPRLSVQSRSLAPGESELSVTYQPLATKSATDEQATVSISAGLVRRARRLGTLDDVLTGLATDLGIYTIPRVYEGLPAPWAAGTLLLRRSGVLGLQRGELTLEGAFFDLCHRSRLMRNVVRRGRSVRDRVQALLLARWEQIALSEADSVLSSARGNAGDGLPRMVAASSQLLATSTEMVRLHD
jgi:hypothetical protein